MKVSDISFALHHQRFCVSSCDKNDTTSPVYSSSSSTFDLFRLVSLCRSSCVYFFLLSLSIDYAALQQKLFCTLHHSFSFLVSIQPQYWCHLMLHFLYEVRANLHSFLSLSIFLGFFTGLYQLLTFTIFFPPLPN